MKLSSEKPVQAFAFLSYFNLYCYTKVEGHTAAVQCLSFSENGYYLATCAADGVKLWWGLYKL